MSIELIAEISELVSRLFGGLDLLDEHIIENKGPVETIQKAQNQYMIYAISPRYHFEYAQGFLQLALWFKSYEMFAWCRRALMSAGVPCMAEDLGTLPASLRRLQDDELALLTLIDCEEYRLSGKGRRQGLVAILEHDVAEVETRLEKCELHNDNHDLANYAALLRALGYVHRTRHPTNNGLARQCYDRANQLAYPKQKEHQGLFRMRLAEVARFPHSLTGKCLLSIGRAGSMIPYLPSHRLRHRVLWTAGAVVGLPFLVGLPILQPLSRLTALIMFMATYLVLAVLFVHVAYEWEVWLIRRKVRRSLAGTHSRSEVP